LGLSLGIDIIPAVTKICTFICPYCEIGFTSLEGFSDINKRITIPDSFFNYLDENLPGILQEETQLSSITIGYNGEPTLTRNLDGIIFKIKEIRGDLGSNTPISIFTNSSTILDARVCLSLSQVDNVVAKLDAGIQEIFQKVNKPHPSVPPISDIVTGLRSYKKKYPGNSLIIQTMLIDGEISNIQDVNIVSLAHAYDEINPDRIQIYTISRAPADFSVKPVSKEILNKIEEKINAITELNLRNKLEIFPFR
jgi:wyosine [tRNA(Phe)-imidazoG37] synthetase (radical SAM superfamily)